MKRFNAWDFVTRNEMISYVNENNITVIQIIERPQSAVSAGLYRFTVYGIKEIIME